MATRSEDYERYRANKMETGLIFQDFIVDTCASLIGLHLQQYSSKLYQFEVGETRHGAEIKHDEIFATSGNLWIETAEKARPRPGPYAQSGIYRSDNSWLYIIGDYDTVFVFQTNILRLLAECSRYPIIENRTKTSMGFLLAQPYAERYAGKILTPKAAVKVHTHVLNLEELGRELHAKAKRDERQMMLFPPEE